MNQTTQEIESGTFESLWTLENVSRLTEEFLRKPNETQFCFASKWFHYKIWAQPEIRIELKIRAVAFLAEVGINLQIGNFFLFRTAFTEIDPRKIRLQFLDWEIIRLKKLASSASDFNTEEAG